MPPSTSRLTSTPILPPAWIYGDGDVVREAGKAADLDVLADDQDHLLLLLLNGTAIAVGQPPSEPPDRRGLPWRRQRRTPLTKSYELLVLADEVGLGVDLDHDAHAVDRQRRKPYPRRRCGRPSSRKRPDPFRAGTRSPCPCRRRHSVRAFLQSIMPTPVISRRFFTSAAVIAILLASNFVLVKCTGRTRALSLAPDRPYSAARRRLLGDSRPACPRCMALAMTEAISLMARIASSLPGMG